MAYKIERLAIYCTEVQYNKLKAAAKQEDVPLSRFVRERLCESRPAPPPIVDWKSYTAKIKSVGQRIDSLAWAGNTKKWIDPDDYDNLYREFDGLLGDIENILEKYYGDRI